MSRRARVGYPNRVSSRRHTKRKGRAKTGAYSRAPKQKRLLRDIGKRVRSARLAANLTQEQAAAEAAIDSKRWQRIEYGEVNPTATTLLRVAEAVNTDVWELLRSTNQKARSSGR